METYKDTAHQVGQKYKAFGGRGGGEGTKLERF